MVGARKVVQSIDGSNTSGDGGPSSIRQRKSLSTVKAIRVSQAAHRDRTDARTISPRKRPCTKGVANASSAQAPNIVSPDPNLSSCGVGATVTGNAQQM